jgi:hypothetical protein
LIVPALVLAQTTTTVSGTVYDPRTTASSLPLPHILVYVTTTAPDPLTPGVQCLTTANIPSSAISSAVSGDDGTFTLTDVPVSTSYYLVIQAGKWRRIFANTWVDTTPLTGLALHMPSNHNQGDIPLIAISTGSVDGFECVFRDMGMADTEFTDDNGTVNPGGRIHIYKGMSSAGAIINTSTPSESVLVSNATLLDTYDVIMFPCQGGPAGKTSTQMTNVVNYANVGGRVFATHYSYDWLNPASPYFSGFTSVSNGVTTGVAKWDIQTSPAPDPGTATIKTDFTDGATLSQWLYNGGLSYKNVPGQIQVSTLRHDTDSVIAPTQSWLTLNSNSTAPGAIMQFTFNTPVGQPAANQCGRVLFTEYHVMNLSTSGLIYPKECPTTGTMSTQEAMLEYALFDLSAFVQPVVVPTLDLTFVPSPMVVNQGDAADQVTITATNTSSSVAIDPSAVLTVVLPAGMTPTALTDTSTTGGWVCTLATLTCARSSSIPSSTADAVVLTVSIPAYPAGGLASYSGQITASVTSPTFSSNVVATDSVIFQQTPVITWPTPTSIIYGTALSGTQLNATAAVGGVSVAGTFAYTPAAGAVLPVGTDPLAALFTPTDTVHYTTAPATNSLTVLTATPIVTLGSSATDIFLSNPVTFTASVSSLGLMPTGTVIFYDGLTQLGTGTLNSSGVTTFTTSTLATGNHSIVASYTGDTTYNFAASLPLPQLIEDFTLTLGGSGSATIGLGQSTTFPVTVSPVVGTILPGAITFTATGLPPETWLTYSPSSLAAGSGSIVDYVQVTMSASFAQAPAAPSGAGRVLPLTLGLLLLPFSRRIRRMARRWQGLVVVALVALVLAAGLSACSFTLTPNGSTVTMTATSGNLSHTTTFKVTVQ